MRVQDQVQHPEHRDQEDRQPASEPEPVDQEGAALDGVSRPQGRSCIEAPGLNHQRSHGAAPERSKG